MPATRPRPLAFAVPELDEVDEAPDDPACEPDEPDAPFVPPAALPAA
jgi:hypothetical protein